MDRYDRIIGDVQRKTRDGLLRWTIVSPSSYARILLNQALIIRAVRTDYSLGSKSYSALFVQRKREHLDELGDYSESLEHELFILDEDGEIVLPLYDGVVERDDLWKLAGLIETNNDQARDFFAAFDASDVA